MPPISVYVYIWIGAKVTVNQFSCKLETHPRLAEISEILRKNTTHLPWFCRVGGAGLRELLWACPRQWQTPGAILGPAHGLVPGSRHCCHCGYSVCWVLCWGWAMRGWGDGIAPMSTAILSLAFFDNEVWSPSEDTKIQRLEQWTDMTDLSPNLKYASSLHNNLNTLGSLKRPKMIKGLLVTVIEPLSGFCYNHNSLASIPCLVSVIKGKGRGQDPKAVLAFEGALVARPDSIHQAIWYHPHYLIPRPGHLLFDCSHPTKANVM